MKARELATPVRRVATIYNDITIKEAIAKMAKCRYTMIPVLERNSLRYLYSVSTGDILLKLVADGDMDKTMREPISLVPIERLTISCNEDVEIDELFDIAVNQNFIPLVDSIGAFKGIITRRAILTYLNSGDNHA